MAIAFPKILYDAALGKQLFVQRGYTYGIDDTGPWQRFMAIGPNDLIEELANELANAGWVLTVTREIVVDGSGPGDTGFSGNTADFGISKIEARAGWQFPQVYGTETPENIWELSPQDTQEDITKADMPFTTLPRLTDLGPNAVINTAKAVKDMIDSNYSWIWADPGTLDINGNPTPFGAVGSMQVEPNTGESLFVYAFNDQDNPIQDGVLLALSKTPVEINLPSADYLTAKNLFYALKAGFEVFPQEATVIRHSVVTSNQYAQQAGYNNVGRIISTASMYSIEGVPNSIFFSVPTSPLPGIFLVTPGDLQYGWRKIRTEVTRLNRMKWRIQSIYQFGLWPINFFGAVL